MTCCGLRTAGKAQQLSGCQASGSMHPQEAGFVAQPIFTIFSEDLLTECQAALQALGGQQ